MTRAAAALALLLALTGCSRGGESPEETAAKELAPLLDTGLGSGMSEVGSATGPMTAALAAKATAVHPGHLEPWLETHGFQGGYSRVWSSGSGRSSEVVSALVFHFFAERNASEFVVFSMEHVSRSALYQAFSDPAVPGSRGYTLTSRVGKETKFCAGEYFTVGRDAYVVTRCAPYPLQAVAVTPLAQRQLAHAVTSGSR